MKNITMYLSFSREKVLAKEISSFSIRVSSIGESVSQTIANIVTKA